MSFSLFRSRPLWICWPCFELMQVSSGLKSDLQQSLFTVLSGCTWSEWLWSLLGSAGRMSMPLNSHHPVYGTPNFTSL